MTEFHASVASVQYIGARARQEDSIIAHAADREGPLLAVLSDGMGGHDDGDLASRIIAGKMFSEMFVAASRHAALAKQSSHMFRAALNCANLQLRENIDAGRLSAETGGTLVCVTILDGHLRWVSVGDSPLYHFRAGKLRKINKIHSLAAQLDLMVSAKQIDAETARAHPDRDCLTSAVTGRDIDKIDCPEESQHMAEGDIVLLASDGLNVLPDTTIEAILARNETADSDTIAGALLDAVRQKCEPTQDNTSVIAIKIAPAHPRQDGAFNRLGQWMSRKVAGGRGAQGGASLAGQRA